MIEDTRIRPIGEVGADAGVSLDPEDWEAMRPVFHQAVDDMLDWMASARNRPAWDSDGVEAVKKLEDCDDAPGRPAEEVYSDFMEAILPGALGNTHPRFWGWVHGTGTPVGALAEFLAGAMNANLGGRNHSPVRLEQEVVRRFARRLGFPPDSSGILLSGTSMATLTGLAVARHWACGPKVREEGVDPARRLIGYSSREGHGSVAKAFDLLGIGSNQLHEIRTLPDGSIDVVALADQVAEDRGRGFEPFLVVATAGSVNTGAIDDMVSLRDICDHYGLWMHVDGAFGALAALSPARSHRLRGMETADSLAFDFHKWFHVPYDAGCLLVRDAALHQDAFKGRGSYLTSTTVGPAAGELWPCDLGIELSRGFRALKVWFTLETYGWTRMGALIDQNCDQAEYLASIVEEAASIEVAAPVSLNIVCLRFTGDEGTPEHLQDRLTQEIVGEVQAAGLAVPSLAFWQNRPVIRVCITNHRTRKEDLDLFVRHILEVGERLQARVSQEYSSISAFGNDT